MKSMKPDVWNKLVVLGEKQGAIRLSDLALEMGLGPEETLVFLRQVFPAGTGIEIYHQNSECWVDIKGESIQYMLPLSPGEWMQIHKMLHANKTADTAVMHSLRKKVSENGPIKVVMELLNQLELWDQELNESEQYMVQQLDTAIVEKQLLCLATYDNRTFIVHPCRVLHLEGQLTLIAEDSNDHCLVVVPLKEVKDISMVPSSKLPQVSPYEVEEFISAVRTMNEKETRLILKIHDPGTTNLFPEHHFLGKPCMITNPNGDLIWAAYVEPCEALYDWLLTLGKNVEILDPVKFKDDYLIYCEEKLRKIA
ncbi:WYL domain-containing protein [Peredibacter starrii]|uniref:WYL domain-containing protein n=1 Tax=Peredibacter starrii TaxID=28202 RepID=A0AAX4HNC9_9BACT|nr:WYL domain-containing protein [Peredibacter starrii]WPU64419.1 WYL domain-containing protein [Peredibacter starrii]